MMDVIQYIRSFFIPNRPKRKRSATELFDDLINAKHRKLSANSPEGDWVISTKRFYPRKQMDSNRVLKPIIALPTIIIDEEDDATEFKKFNGVKPKSHMTSTPNVSSFKENGTETTFEKCSGNLKDVAPLNATKSDKLNTSKLSNNSIYYTPRVTPRESLLALPATRKYGGLGTTTDLTFRLDEKRKYQELLNKSNCNSGLVNSFIDYYTPLSKTPQSRGRRLVELAKSTPVTVDLTLTNGETRKDSKSSKTATCETILKVLDDLDNDVVVVKDNDSDVEYLPTPPLPKSDFKFERINSLKQLVACEPLKENWIGDKVRKHEEELQKLRNELATRHERLLEVRQINHDIVREQLEDQVKKCLHIKEVVIPIEIKEILPDLTAKQKQMVEYAFDKRAGQGAVLASKFSLNITRRDMLTLSGLNWLNDEVINFYMNLIIERGKIAKFPNAYAFNTFFYPKILKDGQQSVRRWTRKVDIFAQDIVCVPIHLGMHWCMAVIDLRCKTITYYDSMGKPNHQCTDALFKYLKDEHLDKKQVEFNSKGWKLICPKDIPQQMNGSDCGMFSCTYAEFSSRNAPFSFSQEDMPYLRHKMVVEIMSGQLLMQ